MDKPPPKPAHRPSRGPGSKPADDQEKSQEFDFEPRHDSPAEQFKPPPPRPSSRPVRIQPADPEAPQFRAKSGLEQELEALDTPNAAANPEAVKRFTAISKRLDEEGPGGPTAAALHYPALGPQKSPSVVATAPQKPLTRPTRRFKQQSEEPRAHESSAESKTEAESSPQSDGNSYASGKETGEPLRRTSIVLAEPTEIDITPREAKESHDGREETSHEDHEEASHESGSSANAETEQKSKHEESSIKQDETDASAPGVAQTSHRAEVEPSDSNASESDTVTKSTPTEHADKGTRSREPSDVHTGNANMRRSVADASLQSEFDFATEGPDSTAGPKAETKAEPLAGSIKGETIEGSSKEEYSSPITERTSLAKSREGSIDEQGQTGEDVIESQRDISLDRRHSSVDRDTVSDSARSKNESTTGDSVDDDSVKQEDTLPEHKDSSKDEPVTKKAQEAGEHSGEIKAAGKESKDKEVLEVSEPKSTSEPSTVDLPHIDTKDADAKGDAGDGHTKDADANDADVTEADATEADAKDADTEDARTTKDIKVSDTKAVETQDADTKDVDPKDASQAVPPPRPESRPAKPLAPKPKSALASRFEAALRENEAPKPKPVPKPKPRLSGSGPSGRVAALQASMFADLNAALSRGPPGRPRFGSQSSEGSQGSSTSGQQDDGDGVPASETHVDANESADSQISMMPKLPKSRAAGPGRRRRLPASAKPKFAIVVPSTPLWEIPESSGISRKTSVAESETGSTSSRISNESRISNDSEPMGRRTETNLREALVKSLSKAHSFKGEAEDDPDAERAGDDTEPRGEADKLDDNEAEQKVSRKPGSGGSSADADLDSTSVAEPAGNTEGLQIPSLKALVDRAPSPAIASPSSTSAPAPDLDATSARAPSAHDILSPPTNLTPSTEGIGINLSQYLDKSPQSIPAKIPNAMPEETNSYFPSLSRVNSEVEKRWNAIDASLSPTPDEAPRHAANPASDRETSPDENPAQEAGNLQELARDELENNHPEHKSSAHSSEVEADTDTQGA